MTVPEYGLPDCWQMFRCCPLNVSLTPRAIVPYVTSKRSADPHDVHAGKDEDFAKLNFMPNREPLCVRSTRADFSGRFGRRGSRSGGESDADGRVLVAFCVVGFAAAIFFVLLSSTIAHAITG
jgi:hypothetical protein